MYRVLLPVDVDEERASKQVNTLLSLPGEREDLAVTLVHVYEAIETPADEAGSTFINDLNENLEEVRDIPESIRVVEKRLDEAGIAYDRQERVGGASEGILEAAAETDADCILIGMRKRSPVGKALFGSVSQRVVLDSKIPVTIAK